MRKCFREQKKRQKQQERSHKARLPETNPSITYTFNKLVQEQIKEAKLEHSGVIVTGIRSGRRM